MILNRSRMRRAAVDRRNLIAKLVRFSLVGGTGVVVNMAVLYLLYQQAHVPLLIASVLAVEMAIASNFILNDQWTFGQRQLSPSRFIRFNAVSLGGLAITTSTLYFLKEYGVYYLFANLVGICLAMMWNFFVNISWTWRAQE